MDLLCSPTPWVKDPDGCRRTALRLRLQDSCAYPGTLRLSGSYVSPIGNKLVYITSGHYAKYGKDSFQPIHTPEEGEEALTG